MDSSFDMVRDNALQGERTLFIILYLCRNEKNKDGSVIDPDMTSEVLIHGKEKDGKRASPVSKLTTKGMSVNVVYNYNDAVEELMSGRYRECFVACSPGDGKLPTEDGGTIEFENDDLKRFINCLEVFVSHGGNIMFMLRNYPYTFEAEVYFKTYYNIDVVSKKSIPGGMIMNKEQDMKKFKADVPGTFVHVCKDPMNNEMPLPIGSGIVAMYEGRDLAALNESALVNNEKGQFDVFAREHEGNAAIMISCGDDKRGRIIIDAAASKLFGDFGEEGVPNWISNSAAFLLNQERYYTDECDITQVPTTLDMPKSVNLLEHDVQIECREPRN